MQQLVAVVVFAEYITYGGYMDAVWESVLSGCLAPAEYLRVVCCWDARIYILTARSGVIGMILAIVLCSAIESNCT